MEKGRCGALRLARPLSRFMLAHEALIQRLPPVLQTIRGTQNRLEAGELEDPRAQILHGRLFGGMLAHHTASEEA